MTLRELLADVQTLWVEGSLDVEARGLCHDSRRVSPGDAFFALAGERADGLGFARQAVRGGAVAVIGRPGAFEGVTTVAVADPRRALARAAATFHRHPSLDLVVVAVTGTNGKTTTTYLMEAIFEAAGLPAGMIGTTGVRMGGGLRPSSLTTPESLELQAWLAAMRDGGVRAVALEMSSHALVQGRGFGLHHDVAIFTNLGHDHLDYHGTLDAYRDAKRMLFDGRNGGHGRKPWTAVVNADDPAGQQMAEAARSAGGAVRFFGEQAGADVTIERVVPRSRGLEIALREGSQTTALDLPMLGRHNAWNAAAAFAAARALRVPAAEAARGLASVSPVPGRLERVERGQGFEVVVDYAHTPEALAHALAAARTHAGGRVLLVFGCGGERDRSKRPAMGRAAVEGADLVWVTNDNPRGEDPAAIAREILAGIPGAGARLELDRRAAISEALGEARPGDMVLIAGKGHETIQIVGDRVLPFDDRAVAAALLEARPTGSAR